MYNVNHTIKNKKELEMIALKKIDVKTSWGDSMILNCESSDTKYSAEHFAEHCILQALRTDSNVRTFQFDLSDMKFGASLQSIYCIAFYLINNSKLEARDVVERIVLTSNCEPLMSNIFIQATFEAAKLIPPVVGDYKWRNKQV